MDVEQFATRMLELMPQVMRHVARHENNYLSRGKITIPQFWALEYLSQQGESTMTSVAQILGISKPSATGVIDRLILQDLVSRRHDEKDRRIVWIAITARGRRILKDILRQKHRTMVKIFSGVPATARARHLQLFEQIVKILDAPVNSEKKGTANKTKA